MAVTATIQQVVAELDIALADHDPYVWGGTSLYTGADCSGVIIAALEAVGVTGQPRTTQAQFASWEPAPGPGYGIAVYFVVPSDGGDPPQHVGVCLTATTEFEEPYTGLDAEVVPIPNIPGVESIMGYRYLPVEYAPPPPPPPPISSFKEDEMQAVVVNGEVFVYAVGPNGHLLEFQRAQPGSDDPHANNVVDVTAGITEIDPATNFVVQP